MIFRTILILSVVAIVCHARPQAPGANPVRTASSTAGGIQKQKLRFKISGRGLPDEDTGLGTSDPYVELYYTENGGKKETKFGRSDTITDTENPEWGNVFEFDFDRSRNQKWHLKVYDHDNLREDEGVGKAWVNVEDYVDRGQKYTTNLHKKGTLTIVAA